MDWIYLFYFLLGTLLFFGSKLCSRGEWNEEYTSRDQTKILTGIMTLGVALHHLAQKTCAPWLSAAVRVRGLEFFLNLGFLFVAVFFFCSSLGLYRSLHSKPDYLKGFICRRVLRIVIAFYLSEFIYTAARLLMGERMNLTKVLWYLSGLHMANTYAWYVITITFFYLAFWIAFRFCKREGSAIFWVFVFTLVYTVLGSLIGYQDDWWMRGEWWYNSIILFPLGLLFGKYEKQVTRFFRKGYWIWLFLSFMAVILLFRQSELLVNYHWGYSRGGTLKVPYRLLSAGSQWIVCIVYVAFCFLLTMKVRLGNKVLAWLGAMSLEFYLTHGLFAELFSNDFLGVAGSLIRIRSIILYILTVLACTVPAAWGFHVLRNKIYGFLTKEQKQEHTLSSQEGNSQVPEKIRRLQAKYQAEAASEKVTKIIRNSFFPALFVILLAGIIILSHRDSTNVVGGLKVVPPDGYSRTFSDSRYIKWEYKGDKKKPGILILDKEIKGDRAQQFSTVEAVMEECSNWLTDMEIYTNPQGIRMVRGYSSDYSEYPDRRYYVENDSAVFLLTMIEDSRYYNTEDCETVMQEVADSICHQ